MSNPSVDNLFLDPTWRDPDVSMNGVSREGISALGAPPSVAGPSVSMHGAGAEDPFSQLSLSRGPSGETLHLAAQHTGHKEPFFMCTRLCIINDCVMYGYVILSHWYLVVRIMQALQIITEWIRMHRHCMYLQQGSIRF